MQSNGQIKEPNTNQSHIESITQCHVVPNTKQDFEIQMKMYFK